MLTLNVGLSKKVGLPDYGSLGVSCHVEVEVDSALLASDSAAFQQKARQVFAACNEAINEELARQREAQPASSPRRSGHSRNGSRAAAAHSGQSGSATASNKQLSYARQLAAKVDGLGARGLDDLTATMFGKALADLSGLEASSLIDTLKALLDGKLDLAAVRRGVSP